MAFKSGSRCLRQSIEALGVSGAMEPPLKKLKPEGVEANDVLARLPGALAASDVAAETVDSNSQTPAHTDELAQFVADHTCIIVVPVGGSLA